LGQTIEDKVLRGLLFAAAAAAGGGGDYVFTFRLGVEFGGTRGLHNIMCNPPC